MFATITHLALSNSAGFEVLTAVTVKECDAMYLAESCWVLGSHIGAYEVFYLLGFIFNVFK
jgi:hypothetical protein